MSIRFLLSPVKNQETNKLQKGLKKRKEYHGQIIYMSNQDLLKQLTTMIKSGDIVEIYAEGIPWAITGTSFGSKYDESPFSLAKLFDETLPLHKELAFSIELHSCNSGTVAKGPEGNVCFAQDLSEALFQYGFQNVQVKGYTGYIQAERLFRQSVVAKFSDSGSKIGHSKLEDAEATYQNGKSVKDPNKVIVRGYTYSSDELAQYFKAKKELSKLVNAESKVEKKLNESKEEVKSMTLTFTNSSEKLMSSKKQKQKQKGRNNARKRRQ